MGKLVAHRKGLLHRAFSIFIFNPRGELLLQRRTRRKYHSGGLWSNTCCSHPRPGETVLRAAHRRLKEEMGFDTKLKEIFSFVYKVKFLNGLIEHEYDHVLVGRFGGTPKPNPKEAEACKWIALAALRRDIRRHPRRYSFWLQKALPRVSRQMRLRPLPRGSGRRGLSSRQWSTLCRAIGTSY